MEKPDKGRWKRFLHGLRRSAKKLWTQVCRTPFLLAVLVFVAASTYCNYLFGLRIGHTIFAAAMAAGDVLKGFLWRESLRASGWARAITLGTMGVLLSVFSIVSAFGSIAFMRFDATHEIDNANAAFTRAQTREAELTQKLTSIPEAAVLLRQVDEILDQPSPQKRNTKVRDHVGDCQGSVETGFHVNTYCPQINELRRRAETVGEDRRKLETELATVRKTIAEIGTVKDADPQITLISAWMEMPRDNVMIWLVIFASLVLEAVSSFGLWAITPEQPRPKTVVEPAVKQRRQEKKGPKGKSKETTRLNGSLPVRTVRGKHLKLVYSNDNLDPPPTKPTAVSTA